MPASVPAPSGMSDTKTVWRKVDPPSNDPAALLGRCLSDAELRAVFDAHAADGVLCSRAQVLRAIADLGLPASQASLDKLAEGDRSGDRKVDWVEFQVLAHEHAARASFSAMAHGLAIICCVAMFWYPFYDAIGIPAVQKLIEHWVDGVCWTERRGYSWWKGAATVCFNSEVGAGRMRAGIIHMLCGVFFLAAAGIVGTCFAYLFLANTRTQVEGGEAGGSALDIVTGNAFGRFHGFDVHSGNRRHKVYLVRLLIYNVNGMLSVVCWMAFEFIFDGMQASAPVAP